ncbi:hypothetical protein E2C01_055083 [Portunus trituberculatus]|uniref:Uncharacterized protein n=1 Tax=Portunus trituberculatus TaxID=210409 RepID=A0A5B7GQ92_PORTR|nr:hypothetical protein [Portunus trituberculatus]
MAEEPRLASSRLSGNCQDLLCRQQGLKRGKGIQRKRLVLFGLPHRLRRRGGQGRRKGGWSTRRQPNSHPGVQRVPDRKNWSAWPVIPDKPIESRVDSSPSEEREGGDENARKEEESGTTSPSTPPDQALVLPPHGRPHLGRVRQPTWRPETPANEEAQEPMTLEEPPAPIPPPKGGASETGDESIPYG